jgi:hypothetical protein
MLKRSPKKRPNTEDILHMPLFNRKSIKNESHESIVKDMKHKLIKKLDSVNRLFEVKSIIERNKWESMKNLCLRERVKTFIKFKYI